MFGNIRAGRTDTVLLTCRLARGHRQLRKLGEACPRCRRLGRRPQSELESAVDSVYKGDIRPILSKVSIAVRLLEEICRSGIFHCGDGGCGVGERLLWTYQCNHSWLTQGTGL